MQHVQVFHVGSPSPTVLPDADFYSDAEGGLTVSRGGDVVAQFPNGKWSAVIKMDVPATVTQAAAHTYTATCAGHHGINEKCR